jgi:ABC-type bacteriocin/lantibiotic exporter with double-glycine peptidase domain
MFYSRFLSLISIFLVASMAGCMSLDPSATGSLRGLSKHAVRLELACQRQTASNLCGLAVLGMVTSYYQQSIPGSEIDGLHEEADTTDGISGASLKAVLEEAGYFVSVFPGTLDHQVSGLYRHLDLKRPLIVMTGSSTRHYLVAVGYDETKSLIVLLDPAVGAVAVSSTEFMREWKQANYFTLLAMPDAKKKNG